MRPITAGLLGAAALAVSLIALRQPRIAGPSEPAADRLAPSGERVPAQISLDRIRELGL
ncbi:MAG: hypothetical protein RQ751_01280 [Longimicrobiales bacterium]|nr:hypothetical protein [Longimicrobiales bacterium]